MPRPHPIGKQPRVVAVLTSLESLARFAALKIKPCHMAEIRLDHIGPESDWAPHCRPIEAEGTPVILTLRAAYEGGKWKGEEQERLKILEGALPDVSAVDVELKSGLAPKLKGRGAQIIVSHHDFAGTPKLEQLRDTVRKSFDQGDVAKISTMINSPDDVAVLEKLLSEKWPGPLCVIGMGELGVKTRVEFPQRGSCLTYGYFDIPAAPGQLAAATLMERLG
ncbi:MAG TPA: type I 3-dehydroquinate dehydratase [Verrucomicrobiae bacterium]|nr:type I 3-dehydroquinate dehydratase [Verrucomicrobiae bacterium]